MGSLRRIVLVRHGETVGSSDRFQGSSDADLSDEGRAICGAQFTGHGSGTTIAHIRRWTLPK